MDLNTVVAERLRLVSDGEAFKKESLEILKQVKSDEELQEIKEIMSETQKRLLLSDPIYRQEVEERRQNMRFKTEVAMNKQETERLLHLQEIRMQEKEAGESNSALRTLGLACPKCGGTNLNWMVNGKGKHKVKVPWCFRCNVKMATKGNKSFIRFLRPGEAMNETLKRLRGRPT